MGLHVQHDCCASECLYEFILTHPAMNKCKHNNFQTLLFVNGHLSCQQRMLQSFLLTDESLRAEKLPPALQFHISLLTTTSPSFSPPRVSLSEEVKTDEHMRPSMELW